MTNDEIKILVNAVETFGAENQFGMLVEECAELIVAVRHFFRLRIADEKLVEEMVDVEIMIDQMKLLFSIDDWTRIRKEKLERLNALTVKACEANQCALN